MDWLRPKPPLCPPCLRGELFSFLPLRFSFRALDSLCVPPASPSPAAVLLEWPREVPRLFRAGRRRHVATCPSLPGCISQGRTRSEAHENIREAISLYLESLREHGDPVPPGIEEEVVEVAIG